MADGHIHKHLQSMFHLLRCEETLKMAVRLESARKGRTRYLVVVSCSHKPNQGKSTLSQQPCLDSTNTQNNNNNRTLSSNNNSSRIDEHNHDSALSHNRNVLINNSNQNIGNQNNNAIPFTLKNYSKYLVDEKNLTHLTAVNRISTKFEQQQQNNQNNHNEVEESCLLGIDCNDKTTVGLVLRILGDTAIRLDGDGGFCISGGGRTHIFKPVSVQAMWSALQTLHKVCAKARENNFYPSRPSHEWVSYYDQRISSDQSCLNEWNTMDSLETRRPPSPDAIRNKPTEREETERTIRTALKGIIVQLDLDEVTSKYIRTRLEDYLDKNLTEYKSFIDEEMLKILKQMDAPTKIFEHVYLGSEWNASNLEELQTNGVRYILNVTREIDNFFPGMFEYCNVRVYDDDKTNLLKHWDKTYRYISEAKEAGSNVLVHCKMGISRSASVVIAYAMKAYGWSFNDALDHVKSNRQCVKPNKNFLTQLETYQGMLLAMKNKEKLQRSKSDTNLRSVKDARLLPGSEPTPLIQAINAAAKKQNIDAFQNRIPGSINRPKSWSPDSVESVLLLRLPKQHSQSLENLPPDSNNTVKLKKNHVRLPCENGQNYSVSQNQVFHLEETSNLLQQYVPNVKFIINELESNEKRRSKSKTVNKDENVDADVKNLNTSRLVTKPPISVASCDKSMLVSLKRSESNCAQSENESQSEKYSPVLKTRSFDASNILTTATAASNALTTNISNNKPPIVSMYNRHSMQEDAQASIPPSVSPIWSRRTCNPINNNNNNVNNNRNKNILTLRSGSSSSNSSTSSNMSLSNMPSDLISDLCKGASKNVKNLQNAYSLRENSVSNMSQLFDSNRPTQNLPANIGKKNILNENDSEPSVDNMTLAEFAEHFPKNFMQRIKKRCKSDGMLHKSNFMSTVNKRFSSSSPNEYSENTLNNRLINFQNNRSTIQKVNFPAKSKRVKNRSLCRTVETLKLNFESKDMEPLAVIGIAKEPKRGKSLPSSPIASISGSNVLPTIESAPTSTTKSNIDKSGCEEISVKGLVDKYEDTKLRNETNNAFNTATSNVMMPRFKRHTIHQSPQHNMAQNQPPLSLHASNLDSKPPKTILLSNQLQQNSQSFARLKEHFNTASAYNTM